MLVSSFHVWSQSWPNFNKFLLKKREANVYYCVCTSSSAAVTGCQAATVAAEQIPKVYIVFPLKRSLAYFHGGEVATVQLIVKSKKCKSQGISLWNSAILCSSTLPSFRLFLWRLIKDSSAAALQPRRTRRRRNEDGEIRARHVLLLPHFAETSVLHSATKSHHT